MLKITRHFLFACLLGCGLLVFQQWRAFAQEQPAGPQSILQFTPSTGVYRGATFEREIGPYGTISLAGEYRLKARIALQQKPAPQVVDKFDLNWIPLAGAPPDGWQESQGGWRWTPGSQRNSVGFLIAPPSRNTGRNTTSMSDFDELWFDYRDLGGSDNCELGFMADAHAAAAQKSTTALWIESGDTSSTWRPVLRVQAARAAWLPKDNLYLARRVLGMDFDEDWRYQQDGQRTVVQRRFHYNLDKIEALDFLFAHGTNVRLIDLRIAYGGWLRHDTMITWDETPHQVESLPDGSVRVRLLIGEWLRQNDKASDRSRKIFLSEAVVFLKGEANEIAQSKPLLEVVFLADGINRAAGPSVKKHLVSLPARSELLAPGYKRWILDLRPLSRGKWFDVRMDRALLTIRPSDPARQCALQPLALRLVSITNGKEPGYIVDMQRWLRALGGPFNAADPQKKEVEWAETEAYAPLSLLPAASYTDDKNIGVHRLELPAWGLHFLVAGDWTAKHSPEGLTFKGEGGSIDVSWELPNIAMQASSTLFLRIQQGAEHVRSGQARIDFSGDGSSTINFLPNRPIPLGSAVSGKHATRITLHLEMDDMPAILKMQELVLFRPFLIPQADAFSARGPGWEFLPLRAEADDGRKAETPALGGIVVHGTAEPGQSKPQTWHTPVNSTAKNLVAVKINYALSELPSEPCWLTLRARTARKQASLTLCPSGAQGELIQPLAQLVKELGAEETVLSFEWEANPSHATIPLTFDIQAQLGTAPPPSVRELLMRNLSVKVGRHSYFPLAIQNVDDFSNWGSGQVDFGKIYLPAWQKPHVDEAFSLPYFKVRKFILESDRPLTAADMSLLYPSKNRPSAWPDRLVKLALLVAFGLIAWLLWHRGFWQKTWKAVLSSALGPAKYLCGLAEALLMWVITAAYVRRRNLNKAAFLAIFPSAWLIARLANGNYLDGLFGFATIFSIAAIWHEMRWGRREAPAADTLKPVTPLESSVFLLAISAGLAWAAWAQGKGIPLFTALAPLAGTFYFCLAWWRKILAGARSQAGIFLILSGITLLLYVAGLFQRYGQGENYFFTFGGIVAVFSWRALMRYARERIFRAHPALAEKIYGGKGTIYFSGALVGLLVTGGLLVINLAPIAEQMAVIVYYFLVTGTVLEVLALRREAIGRDKQAAEGKGTT